MIPQFDIFAQESNGQVLWQGTAETVEEAEEMVKTLAERVRHDGFIIFNLKTGNKIVVRAQSEAASKPSEKTPGGRN